MNFTSFCCIALIVLSQFFLCNASNFELHNVSHVHTRSRRALSSYSFSRENIPGTNLQSGTFYVMRMKRFPSGFVSWSTRKHSSGYSYIFLDNTPAHQIKYGPDGPWYKDTQWAFLSSSEPGWYHLINRGIPCQYATWSDSETIDSDGTFYLTLDPNHPGTHSEDDFLFKPYQANNEAAGKPYYQLKLKSMENSVISWNAGNSSSDSYYIHVETTDDANWLKRYTWGHGWYDDTLFNFELVDDRQDERVIEEYDDNDENNQIFAEQSQQQQYYATLIGERAKGSNEGSSIVATKQTIWIILYCFANFFFLKYLNGLVQL